MGNYRLGMEMNKGFGTYLAHHGIKGQKWGVRRFQNPDGTWTEAGKERYGKRARQLTSTYVNKNGNLTPLGNKLKDRFALSEVGFLESEEKRLTNVLGQDFMDKAFSKLSPHNGYYEVVDDHYIDKYENGNERLKNRREKILTSYNKAEANYHKILDDITDKECKRRGIFSKPEIGSPRYGEYFDIRFNTAYHNPKVQKANAIVTRTSNAAYDFAGSIMRKNYEKAMNEVLEQTPDQYKDDVFAYFFAMTGTYNFT